MDHATPDLASLVTAGVRFESKRAPRVNSAATYRELLGLALTQLHDAQNEVTRQQTRIRELMEVIRQRTPRAEVD